MEYMAQKMDELIESGIHLENELSEILEKVEEAMGVSHSAWDTVDPRKLIYTIMQLSNTPFQQTDAGDNWKPTLWKCKKCKREHPFIENANQCCA